MPQTSPVPGDGLRRVPVQQRSTERVNRMLDACAQLLDEVGYDKLTTTLIAQHADVAIGSVYQFFGDKRAVVRALDMRYLERYTARLAKRMGDMSAGHWSELVEMVVDEYIDMHRTEAGFRTLHFGDIVDVNLLDEKRSNDDVLADRLLELINAHFQLSDAESIGLAMTVAVATGDALVKLAFRRDPDGDETILAEAKTLIRGYLAERM